MTSSLRRSESWRPSLPVAVFLVLALGLAALLAFQAYTAARYHRASAEAVLRDYAAFAARSYVMRSANQLGYYGFYPALRALATVPAGTRVLPPPDAFQAGADSYTRSALGLVEYFFRYDLRTRTLVTGNGAPEEVKPWLLEIFGASPLPWFDTLAGLGTIRDHRLGDDRRFVFTIERDSARKPATVLGFETSRSRVAPYFRQALAGPPLLPPTLTGGIMFDSLASVRVWDGADVLFESEMQYPPTFAAHDTLGARFGPLAVDLALRPSIAERLIIGGLPRSRLPFLLALLALTAGVLGAALLQLRREYQLARLRTEFVANVSHELRTPLAQIRMFTETMLLDRIRSDEERLRSLQIVDQEARRLTHLVENLLHLTRAERGLARIARESVDVGDLVRRVAGDFEPLAAGRGAELRLEVPEVVSAPLDPSAVRQILLNLLDNALKYGPPGQTVRIGLGREDGRVRLRVDDEGPGVPEPDRERIWERFWRADRHRDSAVAGTGIGLAVVRELVALHGGEAWVEAAPGGGARFVVELRTTQD